MRVAVTPEGLFLPDLGLHLDPDAPVPRAVLSHGHADHARALSGAMWATPETCAVARARLGEGAYHEVAYREPFEVPDGSGGAARITLFSAGHVLGSAMVLVEHGSERLLYTGDVKLGASLTCAPADVPQADLLIVEATFGLPIYRFPEVSALRRRIVFETRDALDAGETPVLLGYALGKGPEVARILLDAGLPVALHGAVHRMAGIYRSFGVPFEGDVVAYERGALAGRALVVPPSARTHPMIASLKRARVIAVTGWAVLDAAYDRYGADVLVPLSDHADDDELFALVAATGARRVLTTHGYAGPFARRLRLRGLDAMPLALHHGDEA